MFIEQISNHFGMLSQLQICCVGIMFRMIRDIQFLESYQELPSFVSFMSILLVWMFAKLPMVIETCISNVLCVRLAEWKRNVIQ